MFSWSFEFGSYLWCGCYGSGRRVIQSLMAVKDVVVCHLFRFVLASIGGHPFRLSLRFDSFMSRSAVSCESSYGVTLTKLVFVDFLYPGCIFSFFICLGLLLLSFFGEIVWWSFSLSCFASSKV